MGSQRAWAFGVWVALTCSDATAQILSADPFENLPLAAEQGRGPAPPQLIFRLLAEIPLPGPLPGDGPRWTGDAIEIPVAGGIAVVPIEDGEGLRILPDTAGVEAAPAAENWVESAKLRMRFHADPSGVVRAERRCGRCSRGWKRKWQLRAAGVSSVAPLVVGKRVYFGSLDNRVLCVRARNGHRVWAVDVGGRVAQPLVSWTGPPADAAVGATHSSSPAAPLGAVLAVLEEGSELLVLSDRDGARIARMKLVTGQGKIVSVPLTTPDGRLAVARQNYAETDAALLLLRLVPPQPLPAAREHQRTTKSTSPAATSSPSPRRISTTSASSGRPGPP